MTDSIIDWIEDHIIFDPEAKAYNEYMLKIARTIHKHDVKENAECKVKYKKVNVELYEKVN